MSKYNYYAKDLNDLFRKTRESYKEALANLEKARKKYKKEIDDTKNGTYSNAKSQAMQVVAAEDLRSAETTFSQTCRTIEGEFKAESAAFRERLKDKLSSDKCLRAADLDSNALALLNSGLMQIDDFSAMASDFAGNPTMLKFVKLHLEKLNPTEAADRQRQSFLLADLSTDNIQKDFDALLDAASVYTGIKSGKFADASASGYITEMMDNWGKSEDIQAALSEF